METIADCNGEGCKLKYACKRHWVWHQNKQLGRNGLTLPPRFDGLSFKCPNFVKRYELKKGEKL